MWSERCRAGCEAGEPARDHEQSRRLVEVEWGPGFVEWPRDLDDSRLRGGNVANGLESEEHPTSSEVKINGTVALLETGPR